VFEDAQQVAGVEFDLIGDICRTGDLPHSVFDTV
jgi:hypothetical protein